MESKKSTRIAIMPKEELEVKEGLKLVSPNIPKFSSLVLPDEAAEAPDVKNDSTARCRELDFFSPVRGMINISNRLDGKLYAKLHEDESGKRIIEYRQRYQDGRYSPLMSIQQASMMIAAKFNFLSKDISERKIRSRISDFILDVNEEYYGKFRGAAADELNTIDILNVLYEALQYLTASSDSLSENEGEAFYQMVVYHINNLNSWSAKSYKSYYALQEEDIGEVAGSMGMKKVELLKQLKRLDFLYLTPSSKGYQTNVRVKFPDGKSYTEWRYCIYKLAYFAGVEDDNGSVIEDF